LSDIRKTRDDVYDLDEYQEQILKVHTRFEEVRFFIENYMPSKPSISTSGLDPKSTIQSDTQTGTNNAQSNTLDLLEIDFFGDTQDLTSLSPYKPPMQMIPFGSSIDNNPNPDPKGVRAYNPVRPIGGVFPGDMDTGNSEDDFFFNMPEKECQYFLPGLKIWLESLPRN
jgi:hypothetical protein